MDSKHRSTQRLVGAATATAFALIGTLALATPSASAVSADRDHDGMPNRWEAAHGLNPRVANGGGDADHDRLSNLAEFRHRTDPRDEDSDNDGMDDGDEVRDGRGSTNVRDRDTDDDGRLDGVEDADHDGVRNEDEDDASETCLFNDDDRDHDGVADEDENEQHTSVRDRDSDDDGVLDGAEDPNHDGVTNEDLDDHADDECENETEDADDFLGTIASYDATTGALVIMLSDGVTTVTHTVTDATDVELGHGQKSDTSLLVAGTGVDEILLAADGTLSEVEITPAAP
ncbi:MAG: hypothetical protein HOQ22_06200 [Nocardioidaceae bacterium]|nr:hypothetical protein [Nocardioidaceae bacterium]